MQKGVVNLRGQVIPVMNVRTRFRMDRREYDDRTCVIVVNIQGAPIGLVVDEVEEVIDLPESNVEPPPKLSLSTGNLVIKGMGKVEEDVKILLDVSQLLQTNELERIGSV